MRFERSEIESGGAEPEERRVGLEDEADDGCDVVISYDPKTGKERWRGPGMKGNAVPSPVSGKAIVVVSAGYPYKYAWAFRAGGDGKRLWEYTYIWSLIGG